MAALKILNIQKRNATGKGANRRLRAAGIIPAVFYKAGGESIPVQVEEAALEKIFETIGKTAVFNVEIENKGSKELVPALIWDTEYYPTKKRFQHVDFRGVDLNRDITLRIPLEFSGTAKGSKLGGELEAFIEAVDVVGKPMTLPRKITVDVTPLDLGESFRVADLNLPEGVRPAMDATRTIIRVRDKSATPDEAETTAE